jgi:hypothetical protein
MLEALGPGARSGAAEARVGYAGRRSDATPRPAPPRRIVLRKWKSIRKGSLIGLAGIAVPNGLEIDDIPVPVSNGNARATLPVKPQVDRESRQKTDVTGKAAYIAILEWRDDDLANRFGDTVVALIREAHPGDLDGAGAP